MNKELVNKIASCFHEDWRQIKKNKDGTFKSSWKAVKDYKFERNYIKYLKNGGTELSYLRFNKESELEIDIANCEYKNLSKDWQKENLEAAKVVLKILIQEQKGKVFTFEEVGHIIHEEWRKRNKPSQNSRLNTLFINLDLEDQDKDLRQYFVAKEVLHSLKQEVKL